ncbi:MAG TPA: bacteriohemerythrin [Malonomonas sp.]
MYVFQWDQNFVTGLKEIDQQHQHLVTVTNEFGRLLSLNGVLPSDIEKIYAELVSYTQYHFQEEEKLMAASGVDERHINLHQQDHQGFLQEVTQMRAAITTVNAKTGQALLEFLMNWLVYHILGSDMSMARQIRAIRAGTSAAETYHEKAQDVGKATAPLLGALNNLFKQVSERNKQLVELNQTLESKVKQRTQALSEANQRLDELASTDALTGLPNRRHAMQKLAQLWDESTRNCTALACMMVDADGLKKVNDSYGHASGDQMLQELARQLGYAVRSDDIACRLGGDEFLIICPNTNKNGAMRIAELVHAKIAELKVPVADSIWHGSISVGVAVRSADMKSPEDLIKAADKGVYAAKEAGKNCVRMVI